MNSDTLVESLTHLAHILEELNDSEMSRTELVVCGGSALLACELVSRVTKDVDVLALRASDGNLFSPVPLPEAVLVAAARTANDLGLPDDWLNNGPSSGPGGLFQVGLPVGIESRFLTEHYGKSLVVHYVGRLDQVCFKLYAAVDQMGSYHGQDLAAIEPTQDELRFAIDWVKTQDSSLGFIEMLKLYLTSAGYDHAVQFV